MENLRTLQEYGIAPEAVLDGMADGVSIQDADLRVLYQNRALRDLGGEHVGEYCYRAYEGHETVCEGCPVAQTFRDGGVHMAERTVATAAGELSVEIHSAPLRDGSGRVVAAVESIRDARVRMEAERALRESEAKFRTLVEKSLAGVYIIQDYLFRYVNPRFAEIFGYSVDELLHGMDIRDTVHPDDREVVAGNLDKRLSGEARSIHYEFRAIRKDGEVIDIEVFGSRTIYGGRPAVIGTLLDITGRRRAEQERSTLFHMMSHDIKGPLSVIQGYAEILSQDRDYCKDVDVAGEILKASRRISALVGDMLALSRLESRQAGLMLEDVSLRQLVGQAIMDNALAADNMDVSITADTDEPLPDIRADRAQVLRALGNVIANAVAYNQPGGKVWVRTGMAGDGPAMVFVEVEDTGAGIPDDELPHVFDKYYRGRRSGMKHGTGLGLAIVKAAAAAHGGGITASNGGRGAVFRLTLPVDPGRG